MKLVGVMIGQMEEGGVDPLADTVLEIFHEIQRRARAAGLRYWPHYFADAATLASVFGPPQPVAERPPVLLERRAEWVSYLYLLCVKVLPISSTAQEVLYEENAYELGWETPCQIAPSQH